MKQVISSDGSEIRGLYRNQDGFLVVDDPIAYQKAIAEKNREIEFDMLKNRLNKVESLLVDIYDKIQQIAK